jgi:PilZ domain-containing protein
MHESPGGPERRLNPRTKLVEIAYIGMGPENGGLVLDVSDGGLSFHSVAPIQPAEKIQFLLSLRGHSRIEGTGEVVWTNEMRTICGLKFISLSGGARDYINSWTNQSKAPARARETRFATTSAPAPASPVQPETRAAENENAAASDAAAAAPVFALRPAFDSPLTVPDTGSPAFWREPSFLWILFVVLGSAIGLSAYKYGVQVGRSELTTAASRISSVPESEPNLQMNAPAVAATAPATKAAPAPIAAAVETVPVSTAASAALGATKPLPAGTFMNAAKTEEAPSSATQPLPSEEKTMAATARTEQQLQAGQSELAAAQSYLTGANGIRDSATAARLLWAAVGNGNAAAEALLADLYIRGDGVTKNCEQGRILLMAAIKNGNIEAQQKLKDLNVSGCSQ